MHVYVYVCSLITLHLIECVYVLYVHIHVGTCVYSTRVKFRDWHQVPSSVIFCFIISEQGPSLNLEPIRVTKPPGQ